jgi:DNA-binding transcriptional ArsR family regulator
MNSEESVAIGLRIIVVVLTISLVFSSGVGALASTGGSPQIVSTETRQDNAEDETCVPLVLSFASVSDHTESIFEDRVIETAGDLIDDLSGGDSVVLPVGAVLFRYSRFDDSDPLENDVRQQVYETIKRSPGTYISEMSNACDTSRSTVRYHVRILEEEGLIVGEADRGKHRLYPAGSETPELAAALNDNATARVLDAIARLEPVTVSALADDLDRSPGTVSYHLNRLANDGLLERERMGNTVVTRLTGDIQTELLNGETAVGLAD